MLASGRFAWRKYSSYIYYSLVLAIFFVSRRVSAAVEEINGGEEKVVERYPVARFNFEHVSDIYAITLWILLGSLAKVGKLPDTPHFYQKKQLKNIKPTVFVCNITVTTVQVIFNRKSYQ